MKGIRIFALFLGLFFIGLTLWTRKFFGPVTVDQAISTISFGVHGVLASDSIFIKRFVEWCLFWPLILAIALTLILRGRIGMKFSLSVLLLGVLLAVNQYHLGQFTLSLFETKRDLFKPLYVDPAKVAFKVKQPKSLVFIYVESLETTYSNSKLFNHDLLTRLDSVTASGIRFKNFEQMPGTGWTIAGIVATQCGIPLRMVTIFGGNRMGENINHYLPGAKCLSDILADHGYKNVFIKGAALEFSGVNVFLQDHHYSESYGKDEWLGQGTQANMEGWGLGDDELFEKAKVKLAKLLQSKQPFNLTILTVDMHGLSGKLNDSCRNEGYEHFPGIVECTANKAADFIAYIKQRGWLDRVNVVIMGDHLAMENDVSGQLQSSTHRTIYNALISGSKLTKNTDQIVHYDFLPTILDSLGFDYKDGKLGLGYSAIRRHAVHVPESRIFELAELVEHDSVSYNQLWLSKLQNTKQ